MPASCPRCGARLGEEGSLEGLCPRCLMGLGLSSELSSEGEPGVARHGTRSTSGLQDPFAGGRPAAGGAPDDGAGGGRLEPTLKLDRTGPGRASLLVGSPDSLDAETAALLHRRLRIGTTIAVLGVAAFLARDLIQGLARGSIWDRVALLVILLAVLLALRPRSIPLARLRHLELVVLVALAAWIAFDRYRFIEAAAAAGDAGALVFAVAFAGLVSFAVVTAYGIFVPNGWRRALVMTLGLAALPFLVLAAVVVVEPAHRPVLGEAVGTVPLTSLGLMMLVGVALAMGANQRIQRLRKEAFEARRVGQYRLLRRIGAGGMGEVWEAEHRLLVRPAAVKLIRPRSVDASDPERARALLRWFEREARATAALRSVHTIELYDFGLTDDGVFYYVMELLDGLDLESLVESHGPVEPERAVHLLTQVCESLADAHAAGFIHRDIKPANLFVCRMGRVWDFVKVLDFGLVEVGDGSTPGGPPLAEDRLVGTPGFMAPEILRGEPVDGRADLYSVGCVAYWLLTGRAVFEADEPTDLMRHHLEREPEPLSRHRSEIPPGLADVVMACLAKHPADRPDDAEELARHLLSGLPRELAWTPDRARGWWQERC